MSVKIRLSRVGKKHVPFYRIIVVDSRKKRDGQVLADIGTYDVLNTKLVQFNENLYDEWVKKGAIPSESADRIHRLFKRRGLAAQVKKAAPKKQIKKAEPKAEAAPEVKKEPIPAPVEEAPAPKE